MTLAELREKRSKIAREMHDLHEKATKEERSFTADEGSNWDNMEREVDRIDGEIRRLEKLGQIGAPLPSPLRAGGTEEDQRSNDQDDAEYRETFGSFLRGGMDYLDQEQRELLLSRRTDDPRTRGMNERERRAFAASTNNTGGFTVPQGFLPKLEIAMRAYGGMMAVSDIIRTDTGNALPMPTFNYTNVLATIVGEGSASTNDTSTPFGSATLGAFTYRSPMLQVSYEFLQDSSFGEDYIIEALSGSFARAINAHATNGTGTGQPRGIMLDAVSGKVGATGQTTTVTYDDLVDLVHSVDPAYRNAGIGIRQENYRVPLSMFMMADSSVRNIRKVKDTSGRPIWLPGYDAGASLNIPDTLLGYAYEINQDMPAMAANARSIAFGMFSKYKLRIVRDVTILRLTERYADNLQVGFQVFARADGRLLDAGTNPVKFYQNSAT